MERAITAYLKAKKRQIDKAYHNITLAMATMPVMMAAVTANADAKGMAEVAIGWIGKIALAFGLFRLVIGGIHYATAESDDGPARGKAAGEIGSGVALSIIGGVMSSTAGNIAGLINY